MDRIELDKNALRLPHGSKRHGGNRCTSVNLAQETKDAIDELVPSKYRSAWIERWCRLGLAIQSWDRDEIRKWGEWVIGATDRTAALWLSFGYLTDRISEDVR